MKSFFALFLFSFSAFAAVNPDVRFAVERDDVRSLERYIRKGEATVDSEVPAPPYGEKGLPLITLAARAGSLEVTRYLVARGARLNATTPPGETALMLAAFFKDDRGGDDFQNPTNRIHEEIVKVLLAAGAEVNNPSGWHSAISYAAYQGHSSVVSLLAAAGADVNNFAPIKGKGGVPNPLMMAILNGQDHTVHLLLDLGAHPLRSWVEFENAVTFAKKHNRDYLVKFLDCALELKPGERYKEKCSRI